MYLQHCRSESRNVFNQNSVPRSKCQNGSTIMFTNQHKCQRPPKGAEGKWDENRKRGKKGIKAISKTLKHTNFHAILKLQWCLGFLPWHLTGLTKLVCIISCFITFSFFPSYSPLLLLLLQLCIWTHVLLGFTCRTAERHAFVMQSIVKCMMVS